MCFGGNGYGQQQYGGGQYGGGMQGGGYQPQQPFNTAFRQSAPTAPAGYMPSAGGGAMSPVKDPAFSAQDAAGAYGPMGGGNMANPQGGGTPTFDPTGTYGPPGGLFNGNTGLNYGGSNVGYMQGRPQWTPPPTGSPLQPGAGGAPQGGFSGPMGMSGGNMFTGAGGAQYLGAQSPAASPGMAGGAMSGGNMWAPQGLMGGKMTPNWVVPPGAGPQPGPPTPPPGYTPFPPGPPTPPPGPPGNPPPGGPSYSGLSLGDQFQLAGAMGYNSPLAQQLRTQYGNSFNTMSNSYQPGGSNWGSTASPQSSAWAQQYAAYMNPNLSQQTRNYNAGLLAGSPYAQYLK